MTPIAGAGDAPRRCSGASGEKRQRKSGAARTRRLHTAAARAHRGVAHASTPPPSKHGRHPKHLPGPPTQKNTDDVRRRVEGRRVGARRAQALRPAAADAVGAGPQLRPVRVRGHEGAALRQGPDRAVPAGPQRGALRGGRGAAVDAGVPGGGVCQGGGGDGPRQRGEQRRLRRRGSFATVSRRRVRCAAARMLLLQLPPHCARRVLVALHKTHANASTKQPHQTRRATPPTTNIQQPPTTATANRQKQDYVPPMGKGALYLRPLLMGSGPILGLGPAPSYTFAIYCAAVGSYFKVGVVGVCSWRL